MPDPENHRNYRAMYLKDRVMHLNKLIRVECVIYLRKSWR
jgi:hypothetical protein